SFIKVAELKRKGKGDEYILKKFGVIPIPPGSIVDGRIEDMKTISEAITTLFKTNKIREKNVAIATGGYSVIIKTINMARATEEELQDQIYAEAEQYIPYDIEEVNIDYQVLGESEFSPEQISVLLVAVKKDLVAEYIDLIDMAGLNPCIIEVDTFALQNIYERLPNISEDKISMLIDVGVSKTSLNIVRGGSSLMMRDNANGIAQIRDEIAAEAECTEEEADIILADQKSDLLSVDEIKEITLGVIDEWCADIYGMVSTFRSKTKDDDVELVFLTGGGALVSGFPEALASELNTSVSILNPFEGIQIDKKRMPKETVNELAPLASVAIGLGLRRVNDK
ncbi:MAG: type IV pilus assembly protein PilM, partial [Desulfobacteraceae bacterium]|nr:type IV pilus assembly protein PilM [Desulfobacteraceae bacterium]